MCLVTALKYIQQKLRTEKKKINLQFEIDVSENISQQLTYFQRKNMDIENLCYIINQFSSWKLRKHSTQNQKRLVLGCWGQWLCETGQNAASRAAFWLCRPSCRRVSPVHCNSVTTGYCRGCALCRWCPGSVGYTAESLSAAAFGIVWLPLV